jgi:hypothetical protein
MHIMESLTATSATADSIEKAAQALKDADCLLIVAGAGFSADSGLATCETMPEEHRELCDPLLLMQQLSQHQSRSHSKFGVGTKSLILFQNCLILKSPLN